MSIFLDSFLLIYNLPVVASSPTTEEHINSFARHSKFKILSINTEFGFPKQIAKYTFRGFIFHHSLFDQALVTIGRWLSELYYHTMLRLLL